MSLRKVFLLLNGEVPSEIPNLNDYDIICATDGAYQFLKENNITPDFISGDFDSIQTIPENIKVINTPNQNYTDFDKILKILFERHYKTIDVFGGSGKEQDHFLGNLHTAIHWKSKMKITFFDNYGFYFLADKNTELSNCKDKTVSLVPISEVTSIRTSGLQYPLDDEDLIFGKRIGTRNLAVEDAISITFKKGHLFVFIYD